MLIILDGWSVHRSEEFRNYIATNYPFIHLAFLPPNCTSIAQPADTGLQRPLKARIHASFDRYSINKYLSANKKGIDPDSFVMDIRMATMKPMLVKWLVDAWLSIKHDKQLVLGAWESSTLHQLRDASFRARAIRARGTSVVDIAAALTTPPADAESIESAEDGREHDEASGLLDGEIDLAEGLPDEVVPHDEDDELMIVQAMVENAADDPAIETLRRDLLVDDLID